MDRDVPFWIQSLGDGLCSVLRVAECEDEVLRVLSHFEFFFAAIRERGILTGSEVPFLSFAARFLAYVPINQLHPN
jgi:hypothetical protein